MVTEPERPKWLLLIHQIPPKPDYLRVKIWRRLQRLGAVAIKNSVYVLPRSEQAAEDFQWVAREIVADGGDATVCEARFVEGLSDRQVESMFHQARDADYGQIAGEARRLVEAHSRRRLKAGERRVEREGDLARLRRWLAEVVAIDHLGSPGRRAAESGIDDLERRLRSLVGEERKPAATAGAPAGSRGYARRVWVTRQGIHVDRMASAWLIRRFIDPAARFKFVPPKGYRPGRREIRFDMFDGEFTHEGERCTFEVLLRRFALEDPALRAIAEIVHDIDLKVTRHDREETAGVDHLVAGVAMAHRDDRRRLERGAALFDDLFEYFRRKGA